MKEGVYMKEHIDTTKCIECVDGLDLTVGKSYEVLGIDIDNEGIKKKGDDGEVFYYNRRFFDYYNQVL